MERFRKKCEEFYCCIVLYIMKKSKQFYWKIEDLWEKYYEKKTTKMHTVFDFTPSEFPVFFDDNENNKPYLGLKNDAQIIEKDEKEIFLTDNHHKVLSFLFHQFLKNKQKITLIHIDAHRDDAIFQYYEKLGVEIEEVRKYVELVNGRDFLNDFLCNAETEKIKKYIKRIQDHCRISDYLDIAFHLGFVEKIISITQTSEFENFSFKNLHSENVVLNLDIDIYGQEGEVVSVDLKTMVIAKSWNIANAVCIATSPAFIDEILAEKIIEIFVGTA